MVTFPTACMNTVRLSRQKVVRISSCWLSSSQCQDEEESLVDPFVKRYLSRLHIPSRLHEGLCAALVPVYGKPLTVSHLKSFGKEGLLQLAESVESVTPELGNQSVPLKFDIPHHKTSYTLQWKEGQSVLDLAKSHPDLLGEYMEGTCGGTMSCCTCHVYLSPRMYKVLKEPCNAELDMLDLAYEPKETSRLACQIRLEGELLQLDEQDVVVTIPADATNVWN
jgi:ferredoxin